MADGHHPTDPDVLHPAKNARPRQTALRLPLQPQRHVRPRAGGVSVRQAVDSFLLARTDYRPSTRKEHGDILARFATYAEVHRWPNMTELANAHVRAWLTSLNAPSERTGGPLSKARKNKCGAVVRTFLRWAIAEGTADEKVIHNVKWPQAPKMSDSMLAIAQDDFARLLTACDLRAWHGVRDYAILLLLYDTGIRRGELLAMRLADVEAVDRAASVVSGKSGTRAVGMGIAARRAVRDYLTRARYAVPTDHDMLWINRTGEPLGPRGVGKIIDRLKAAAGVEGRIYPHKLHHTFSTEFLRNGGNAYALQVALGHTSPVVTSNYVHLVAAGVEKAMQTFSPADALTKRRRQ